MLMVADACSTCDFAFSCPATLALLCLPLWRVLIIVEVSCKSVVVMMSQVWGLRSLASAAELAWLWLLLCAAQVSLFLGGLCYLEVTTSCLIWSRDSDSH